MASGDFDPERLLAVLAAHGVDFVLIGGMAAVLHGDVGVTVDVDVVPDRRDDNLESLASALRELEARIRTEGEVDGLAFDCSAAFFKNMAPESFVNMTTSAGDVYVMFRPAGTEGFADLVRSAVRVDATDQAEIWVASLEDVIRSKESADREKDRIAIPAASTIFLFVLSRLEDPDSPVGQVRDKSRARSACGNRLICPASASRA